MKNHYVTKADGERELFNPSKLLDSLIRAGASSRVREQIIRRVEKEMRPGMSTSEIYQHAFSYLREMEATPVAARYSIKRAVFDLGPSGFPFEQLISELLRSQGWKTQTGVAMTGRCAPHEVDVRAEKDGRVVGIEAKFHNEPGMTTDLKDALYVHARFEDLKQTPDQFSRVTEGWLVTNTRFTRNALRYGRCSGLTMVGWDFPRNHGIVDLIDKAGIHPLTCLTKLSDAEKRALLEKNVVLCSSVKHDAQILRSVGVQPDRIREVQEEAGLLCSPSAPHKTAHARAAHAI